jgi:hypothetical protein
MNQPFQPVNTEYIIRRLMEVGERIRMLKNAIAISSAPNRSHFYQLRKARDSRSSLRRSLKRSRVSHFRLTRDEFIDDISYLYNRSFDQGRNGPADGESSEAETVVGHLSDVQG